MQDFESERINIEAVYAFLAFYPPLCDLCG